MSLSYISPDILLITDRIDVGRRSCRNPTYVLTRQSPLQVYMGLLPVSNIQQNVNAFKG